MDPRLKKRIIAFYFAGFLNLVLGLYVLINGRALVEPTTWLVLLGFFFGFAAVDFWFARKLRKEWRDAQARLTAHPAAAPRRDAGGGMRDEGRKP
jgi:hypothetical protein